MHLLKFNRKAKTLTEVPPSEFALAAVCRSVEEAEQLLGTPRQVLLGH